MDLTAVEAIADMIHYYVPSKKAIVFGYGMGGYISIAFGAKYPELCRYLFITRNSDRVTHSSYAIVAV